MMHNLLLEEGDIIDIESVSLSVATFSKFKPQCPDFLEITNQKAVLENALRNFACLTTGDLIAIRYNSRIYELCVLETKPGNAVSIIECDMNVSAWEACTLLLKPCKLDFNVIVAISNINILGRVRHASWIQRTRACSTEDRS